ncbi:DUF1840 domain-containing protein [Photobacterium makurazakiensis]|uniref:DUF1840 domain-containing protein n=1 Tax=Photobacterium makurazakiensis TaxID=2910234 RepID=UPI003D0DAF38
MLVTFKCKASGNIMMFGDVAKQMLQMMGYCENIPGAIDAEDVTGALNKLKAALSKIQELELKAEQNAKQDIDIDDLNTIDVEPVVNLVRRAYPLIEMLELAKKENCHVMWDKD